MLSDNQRRFICRMLFLMICVVPTATVTYWLCHPQTASQWEREIRAQLGVTTRIDSIETPGPFVTILRGLKFTDAELGPILDAMEVKIEFGETNLVTFQQKVRVTNAGLIHLVQTINEHFIRAHAADRPWQIFFREQTIVHESIHAKELGNLFPSELIAKHLQINVEPQIDGTSTRLQFQLPNQSSEQQWVSCELLRSHPDANQQSKLRLQLDTNNMNVPCWLLGDLIPEIKMLGPDCQFAGRVDVNPQNGNPYGWFEGQFVNIDSRAITEHPAASPNERYAADVKIFSFDNGVKNLEAYLIRPDKSLAPIENTLKMVRQFDVGSALREADQSRNYLHANSWH